MATQQTTVAPKSTAIGGMAVLLASAKRMSQESIFGAHPITKEQAVAKLLAQNQQLYGAYKRERLTLQNRARMGDEVAAESLLSLYKQL